MPCTDAARGMKVNRGCWPVPGTDHAETYRTLRLATYSHPGGERIHHTGSRGPAGHSIHSGNSGHSVTTASHSFPTPSSLGTAGTHSPWRGCQVCPQSPTGNSQLSTPDNFRLPQQRIRAWSPEEPSFPTGVHGRFWLANEGWMTGHSELKEHNAGGFPLSQISWRFVPNSTVGLRLM